MKTWPKFLFLLVVLLAQTGCFPFWKNQENLDEFHFEIDPSVKQDKGENAVIIAQLEDFLATKNASISENEYWDPKDLERYRFPFGSLFEIENGPLGKYQYSPKLKEIKPLGSKKMGYRLEIDFIGPNEYNEPTLAMTAHLLAKIKKGKLVLARMVDANTRSWPRVKIRESEIIYQKDHLTALADSTGPISVLLRLQEFFELPPQPIRYYSCQSIEKAYFTAGFKYHPSLYMPISKGPNELWNGHIFAGNRMNEFPHEVSRHYIYQKFNHGQHEVLEKGLATFVNGYDQWKFEYYRELFAAERKQRKNFEYANYFDTYQRKLLSKAIPYSYVVGALICEYVFREGGKQAIFEMMTYAVTEENIWKVLQSKGLNYDIINSKLDQLLEEKPTVFVAKSDIPNSENTYLTMQAYKRVDLSKPFPFPSDAEE